MKKLWIVTELFYPEETSTAFILTKIANALSDKFDVNVICGPESYGRAALEDNPSTKLSLDGRIKIHRVSNCNLNKDKIFTRLLRFLIIGFKLSFSLWKTQKTRSCFYCNKSSSAFNKRCLNQKNQEVSALYIGA